MGWSKKTAPPCQRAILTLPSAHSLNASQSPPSQILCDSNRHVPPRAIPGLFPTDLLHSSERVKILMMRSICPVLPKPATWRNTFSLHLLEPLLRSMFTGHMTDEETGRAEKPRAQAGLGVCTCLWVEPVICSTWGGGGYRLPSGRISRMNMGLRMDSDSHFQTISTLEMLKTHLLPVFNQTTWAK